ncbi:MC/SLC25 family protein [archaeon]|nr:MAG: MC/SLC25 family protein [archaeon]
MDSFIAGFAYGTASVIVGQPLDTIKTRMQAMDNELGKDVGKSSWRIAKDLIQKEGIKGLYRGGTVLLIGGGLFRSAQFGVYNFAFSRGEAFLGSTSDDRRVMKVVDPLVVAAGCAGGIGRGLVEAPFEFIKTRIQVQHAWGLKEMFSGSSATILRNSILFSCFVFYIDLSKQLVPGGLGPFWTGAISANLAWLTIWPLDVVKSQIQSGNYNDRTISQLLKENFKNGTFYRGVVPGLTRSFISNGVSMVVYEKVLTWLKSLH